MWCSIVGVAYPPFEYQCRDAVKEAQRAFRMFFIAPCDSDGVGCLPREIQEPHLAVGVNPNLIQSPLIR
jgi:hypothetical protein